MGYSSECFYDFLFIPGDLKFYNPVCLGECFYFPHSDGWLKEFSTKMEKYEGLHSTVLPSLKSAWLSRSRRKSSDSPKLPFSPAPQSFLPPRGSSVNGFSSPGCSPAVLFLQWKNLSPDRWRCGMNGLMLLPDKWFAWAGKPPLSTSLYPFFDTCYFQTRDPCGNCKNRAYFSSFLNLPLLIFMLQDHPPYRFNLHTWICPVCLRNLVKIIDNLLVPSSLDLKRMILTNNYVVIILVESSHKTQKSILITGT